MKQIQPVSIWIQGQQKQANYIDMKITFDNLSTKAIFRYYLISSVPQIESSVDDNGDPVQYTTYINDILIENQLEISGQDYQNWGSTGDANDEAYLWATSKLNLTLI